MKKTKLQLRKQTVRVLTDATLELTRGGVELANVHANLRPRQSNSDGVSCVHC